MPEKAKAVYRKLYENIDSIDRMIVAVVTYLFKVFKELK